jgi:hypothetical protein
MGLITVDIKRVQAHARKPTHTFTLSTLGQEFLANHPLYQVEAEAN